MKALIASTVAVVFTAVIVAVLKPGATAGVVLALGSPFALFANVMAYEKPLDAERAPDEQGRAALLVDWN